MGTIAEVLSEIKKIKKKKKLVCQQRFLYPLLFQDDLYAIAYNRLLNKFNLKKIENFHLHEQFSFLILKRLIKKIHRKTSIDKLKKIIVTIKFLIVILTPIFIQRYFEKDLQ